MKADTMHIVVFLEHVPGTLPSAPTSASPR
jgi:hypothetical protein